MNKTNENRVAYQVEEIGELLGISRATAYKLVKQKNFPAVRVGRHRIVIPKDAFHQWLNTEARTIEGV